MELFADNLVLRLLHLAISVVVSAFFLLFAHISLAEQKLRAAGISLLIALAGVLYWLLMLLLPAWLMLVPDIGIVAIVLLFFLPLGKRSKLKIGTITERVDERDVMFSREEYLPGTQKYETYYSMRPEHRLADDRLRQLPAMFEPGACYYDPQHAPRVAEIFDQTEALTGQVDGEVSPQRQEIDAAAATRIVRRMLLEGGAAAVGIAELDQAFAYSHVGRGPEKWGEPIVNDHRYVIVFSLEMSYEPVESAPRLPITEETGRRYLQGAELSIDLAREIREMGYPARAHIAGSNYQIMLAPVAHAAGLGELGRLGYLITPRLGPRVRLGAVTTDLPLLVDKPISFGVQEFCTTCKKCADNCPSQAIPSGEKVEVRGVEKWQLDIDKCIYYWRVAGTDCGLCMRVCPYSHPPTFVHNLVRAGIKRSAIARRLALWGDDLFYARKQLPYT
ncbi:MAG: reductive dehalogenase [bacterium]